MHALLQLVVDKNSFFEVQPQFARSLITALARLNGGVVGLVANNPKVLGGALDRKAAQKQGRFIDFCQLFHVPVVFFVDVPGLWLVRRRKLMERCAKV